MAENDHGERLAKLETRVSTLEQQDDLQRRKSDSIANELQDIKNILKGQKSFIAGVVVTVTSIASVAGYFFLCLHTANRQSDAQGVRVRFVALQK